MNTYRNLLLLACCCLTVCLFPTGAHGQPGDSPEVTASADALHASVSCLADLAGIAGIEDPLPMSPCFVSVECSDGSTVSCNGNNSCSTSGSNNRCVTCDGVQVACCALTACEWCDVTYDYCISNCFPTFGCNLCESRHANCLMWHNCF
jgi:hypothetical protein